MTRKVGRGRPRRVSPQLNEGGIKRCVQLSRVTFQKVLLIRICTVNIQDKMGAEKYQRKNYYHRIEYFGEDP